MACTASHLASSEISLNVNYEKHHLFLQEMTASVTPCLKTRGLCLSSTAILHTFAGVQLWLHRMTHQGVLTRRPCSSSLAERAAFCEQRSAHQPNRHGVCNGTFD